MMAAHRRQRGLTLVELLVATGLGALVLLTAGESLLTARQLERVDRASARNLDAARMALTLIAQSVRQAGFPGCHPGRRRNLISGGGDPATPAISANNGLIIRTMRSLGQAEVVAAPAATASVQLRRGHGVAPGQPVVAVNTSGIGCVLFRQASTAVDSLDRGPGSKGINRVPDGSYRPLGKRIELFVPERIRFFVDASVGDEEGSSLFRSRRSTGGGREEMVVGVQSLGIEAGVDDTGDGYADRTVTGGTGLGGLDVVFVRIALEIAAPGASVPAGTGQRLTTTIALRNARP